MPAENGQTGQGQLFLKNVLLSMDNAGHFYWTIQLYSVKIWISIISSGGENHGKKYAIHV